MCRTSAHSNQEHHAKYPVAIVERRHSMKYPLIVLVLDGTLLNSTKVISETPSKCERMCGMDSSGLP